VTNCLQWRRKTAEGRAAWRPWDWQNWAERRGGGWIRAVDRCWSSERVHERQPIARCFHRVEPQTHKPQQQALCRPTTGKRRQQVRQ